MIAFVRSVAADSHGIERGSETIASTSAFSASSTTTAPRLYAGIRQRLLGLMLDLSIERRSYDERIMGIVRRFTRHPRPASGRLPHRSCDRRSSARRLAAGDPGTFNPAPPIGSEHGSYRAQAACRTRAPVSPDPERHSRWHERRTIADNAAIREDQQLQSSRPVLWLRLLQSSRR